MTAGDWYPWLYPSTVYYNPVQLSTEAYYGGPGPWNFEMNIQYSNINPPQPMEWDCEYCQSANEIEKLTCVHCGAPRRALR